jgi:hypothetical protein
MSAVAQAQRGEKAVAGFSLTGERRRAMRTVKWNPFLSGVCTVLGGMLLWAGAARADVTSTNPAAIVVYPKIVVDTTQGNVHKVDTILQLTNTASNPVNARCFYVDANGHCSNSPFDICDPNGDPAADSCASGGGFCVAQWTETDFSLRLTSHQPIEWVASSGLATLPLEPCVPGPDCHSPGPNGEFDSGSIPPVPENPFLGELKCVEVGDDELPNDSNDLKGEATIEDIRGDDGGTPSVDSRGYNAIGIQAIAGQNNHDTTLVLGQEYNACPNILVLDHFFDDAEEPAIGDTVRTDITLVPCSEDFAFQQPITTTVQFLVFNEFEQRFSTSRPTTCFTEIALSDIDTRLGPTGDAQSIFNVNVEGTLTGQTLIRGVADSDTSHGHGLLAIAEEFQGEGHSSAYVAGQRGTRTQADIILMPALPN